MSEEQCVLSPDSDARHNSRFVFEFSSLVGIPASCQSSSPEYVIFTPHGNGRVDYRRD